MTKQDMTGMADPMMIFGGDPSAALEELKDHLLIAPASVWLDVVRRTNIDRHYDLLRWITEQPECDQSIAQLVFYKCKPAQMIERRITVDPDHPNRDAICAIVANKFENGQYPERLAGLMPGEVDSHIANLEEALESTPPEDRVFDVASQLLATSDEEATPIDAAWVAEEDDHVRLLYQANDLTVIGGMNDFRQSEAPSVAVGVIESLLSIVRRPKSAR